jgi:undecaprenyl pyrophosphate synthase
MIFQTTFLAIVGVLLFASGSEAGSNVILNQNHDPKTIVVTAAEPNTIVVPAANPPLSSWTSNGEYYYRMIMKTSSDNMETGPTEKISDNNKEDDYWDLFEFFNENSSHQCSTWEKFCCLTYCVSRDANHHHLDHHNFKPLWWLVLQWMKMMLFKMMRAYHAKPFVLMLAPLWTGLLVGYWIGRQQPQQQQQQASQQQPQLKRLGGTQADKDVKVDVTSPYLVALRIIKRIIKGGRCFISVIHVQTTSLAVSVWRLLVPVWKNNKDICKTRPRINHGIHDNCPKKTMVPTLTLDSNEDLDLPQREDSVRMHLQSNNGSAPESGITMSQVPNHVAVIMDGNRRYGKAHYGSASRGHWEGSSKLVEFAKWCLAEKIQVLTVFAFSSENWNRDPVEVASLMQIFARYCDELREEAIKKDIKILVLSTDQEKVGNVLLCVFKVLFVVCLLLIVSSIVTHVQIPAHVRQGIRRMVEETQHCTSMIMNICLSYGSRDEIVEATKSIVSDVVQGKVDPIMIDADTFSRHLLTYPSGGDPDVLIRTSGEVRISNFLLWQVAYTELFFIDKPWPAIEKVDLLQVIRSYAKGRHRRYGK